MENEWAEFETFKKEDQIVEVVTKFLQSKSKKTLYILMKVASESQHLNYVLSQIEKIKKRIAIEKFDVKDKRVRIVYEFGAPQKSLSKME